MPNSIRDALAAALENVFISPNVADSNLEAANIVDVINSLATTQARLANAIDHLARAIESLAPASRAPSVSDATLPDIEEQGREVERLKRYVDSLEKAKGPQHYGPWEAT